MGLHTFIGQYHQQGERLNHCRGSQNQKETSESKSQSHKRGNKERTTKNMLYPT